MKIGVGCDHGGFVLKNDIFNVIRELGHEILDYGTFGNESVDYPNFARKVALAVQGGEIEKGILICGTGIGISIAANKFKGIRCAHVTDSFQARMSVEHNNANIIALGGRITNVKEAMLIVKSYLTTSFEGGRHQLRLDIITGIEKENFK